MNSYQLARAWFDFAFETKEAKCVHTALFLWIVELNNRVGWKKEFGLPANDTMEGLSIGDKKTFYAALRDLEKWQFIKIVQESKNQFQSCVIQICRTEKPSALPSPPPSALDTAILLASPSAAGGSNTPGILPIDKQINNQTNKPLNNKTENAASASDVVIENPVFIEPEKPKKEKKEPQVAPPPFIPPELTEAMAAWIEMRKKKRNAPTDDAIRLVLSKLQKLAPNNSTKQIEIINESIVSGWAGVFPLKENITFQNNTQTPHKPSVAEAAQQAMREGNERIKLKYGIAD